MRVAVDLEIYCLKDSQLTQEIMNMNANSIKTGSFIIGSIGPNGLSFANHPMVHSDSLSAKMEAEHLAKNNQGKKFIVVEVKGIAEVASVVWR